MALHFMSQVKDSSWQSRWAGSPMRRAADSIKLELVTAQ